MHMLTNVSCIYIYIYIYAWWEILYVCVRYCWHIMHICECLYISSGVITTTSWRIKSAETQLLVQKLNEADIKENVKATYYRYFFIWIHRWLVDSAHKCQQRGQISHVFMTVPPTAVIDDKMYKISNQQLHFSIVRQQNMSIIRCSAILLLILENWDMKSINFVWSE